MMEFHIARNARERYQFAEPLFSYSGNVVFANVAGCREFAYRMNKVREIEKHPGPAVHAGQLYAMGLIDEASHMLMARYREQFDPAVMTSALSWFSATVGAEALGKMLVAFVEHFPGTSVMRGQLTPLQWLSGQIEGTSHWAVALEELLLLWTANRNEAFKPFEELFEEKGLAEKTVYRKVTQQLPEYFATRPLISLPNLKPMSLLELLRAPAVGAPRSLSDQLALIRKLWKPMLGDSLDRYLLLAGEILREEELALWLQFNPPDAAAEAAVRRRRETGHQWPSVVSTAEVPVFGDPAHEYERFSTDTAWMPTTVLVAKSTYVWLAQMSRQYGRGIARLDEIPDEELACLARRGINSLWLIGVWERSRASKTIKQLCGNSDAVASAYSLFDYAIAEDLGGEAAYINLRDRAYAQGLRLASDMVPNHMGIDSPWVVEHPDWFISRPERPYPAYSFNGPDLSHDGRVEIKIEDHYFEQSDAAVVFRRRDRQSGETRYIYHGNDGTSFPWNDTAQLDYLNSAVREQVIQTILHVARLFPVIRFDAAMTLAKRHFHRLWFPGPGASGAIPSRAESGMTQAEFDRCMPHEFWRDVVDRVAAEVPGTLLLAEAFWLMEGYFVRTLGMHRVYNSAFMVMLRDEDNAKYRSVIKNTLEFDPDIMKRYVNFMSNPDERTAIDQFGKGDKCFGVATMMATLPGLPMFGHGQIEGFTEKYGMEYQRPRYDESPDPWMVERHEREIAPLLQRRRLFAESGNFLLYDFFQDAGWVDENVFAYSNRNGDDRALVVYNNRYGETRGTIDYSAAYADKGSGQLRQRRLCEGLGLTGSPAAILAWRDSLTDLHHLRRSTDLSGRGLTFDLGAYECHVYLDWRELYSTAEQPWDRLCDQLNGRGVADLEDALVNLELQPVHEALRAQLDSGIVRIFADLAEHPRTLAVGTNQGIDAERTEFFAAAWGRCETFLRVAQKAYLARAGREANSNQPLQPANPAPANPGLLGAAFRQRLRAAMRIPVVEALFPAPWTVAARRVLPSPSPQLTATSMWGPVLGWCVLQLLAESIDVESPERIALDLFDRLRLREPFAQAFAALGFEGEEAWRVAARVKVGLLVGAGVGQPDEMAAAPTDGYEAFAKSFGSALWSDADVRWLTGVHHAGGHAYLVREHYEELLWWLLMPSLLRLAGEDAPSRTAVQAMSSTVEEALAAAKHAGYRVDLLLNPASIEPAGEEPPVEAEPAESAAEPAAESAIESEVPAEAEPMPAEEPDPAEPQIEPTPEAAVEPETAAEILPLHTEPSEPAEPATEFASEPATKSDVESEVAMEAKPLPAEEPTPAEPQIEPVAEPAPQPETVAEVEPSPTEPVEPETSEPTEPEIEFASELPTEPEVESESADEAEPMLSEEPSPAEPPIESAAVSGIESEAAVEAEPLSTEPVESETVEPTQPEIELASERTTDPEIEFEAAAEAEPLPAKDPDPSEPPITPVAKPAIESEAAVEAEPLPLELVESETSWPTEPEIEPAAESVSESEVAGQTRPLPADPSGPAGLDVEPTAEFAAEPGFAAETEPRPIEEIESAAPEIDPVAESAGEYQGETETPSSPAEPDELTESETESTSDPAAEPEVAAEALPSVTEEPSMAAPEIETAEPYVEPVTAEEILPLPTKPRLMWEPEAAKIDLGDKSDYEPKVVAMALPSLTEPWEPEATKVDFAAKSASEPAAVAKVLPSLTEPWEPAAPEVEFAAKPAPEPKAIAKPRSTLFEWLRPKAPAIKSPADPEADPHNPAD
jgi:glycosidase